MTRPAFLRYQGWAATLSTVATFVMLATAVLSSKLNLGNTFRLAVLALMGLIVVVAVALHLRLRSHGPAPSLAAAVIGIVSALLTGAVHILQMSGMLTPAQFNALGEGIGPAGIGIWLLLANWMALRSRVLPRGLTWVGLIAGAGYLMSGIGALISGPVSDGSPSALSSIGPLGIFFVYPLWAVWLGLWMLQTSKQAGACPEPADDERWSGIR